MGPMFAVVKQHLTFAEWFRDKGILLVAILVVAVAVTILSRLLVNRFRRKLEGSPSVTQEINLQRATTLTNALAATAIVVIWSIAFLMVLGQLDISIAPLLASAGRRRPRPRLRRAEPGARRARRVLHLAREPVRRR